MVLGKCESGGALPMTGEALTTWSLNPVFRSLFLGNSRCCRPGEGRFRANDGAGYIGGCAGQVCRFGFRGSFSWKVRGRGKEEKRGTGYVLLESESYFLVTVLSRGRKRRGR